MRHRKIQICRDCSDDVNTKFSSELNNETSTNLLSKQLGFDCRYSKRCYLNIRGTTNIPFGECLDIAKIIRHKLEIAMRTLPIIEKQIVELHYGFRLTQEEISFVLNLKEFAVNKIQSSAISRLRRVLLER